MTDKDPSPNDCEMAGEVAAFARGELGAKEIEMIREHMHTCRFCLDAYMDLRMAGQAVAEENGKPGEMLPDLHKAPNRGKTPEPPLVTIVASAISEFFSGGLSPKQALALATVVLVIAAVIYTIW